RVLMWTAVGLLMQLFLIAAGQRRRAIRQDGRSNGACREPLGAAEERAENATLSDDFALAVRFVSSELTRWWRLALWVRRSSDAPSWVRLSALGGAHGHMSMINTPSKDSCASGHLKS